MAASAVSRAKRTIRHPGLTHSIPAAAIFARAIVPGKTKTRLIPSLGAEGAAEFHRALISDALRKVAGLKGNMARYLFVAGGNLDSVPEIFECRRQQGRDLGRRIERAFGELLLKHSRVVVIGTDSPALAPSLLRLALEELRTVDAVLGPCPDGGFYLVGLRRTVRGLFAQVRMGTEYAFRDTLDRLLAHGFTCSLLEPCPDIDRPQDLATLKKYLRKKPAIRRLMPDTWRLLAKMD
ncbi:MAG TPA: TIGR04282 family arsenosugar biosynthesis glycosyltransferase [Terriglobia bacterium]|nr:TIGR04282 family arsenosugar biosynthesis glycosyltransferase [Terriglobia bacterium]